MTESEIRPHDASLADDAGSMMLALVTAFAMTGLVVLALGAALMSQDSARRDRATTNAVQVADAGVQQAAFLANNGAMRSQFFSPAPNCATNGETGRVSPTQVVDLNGVLTAYQIVERCAAGISEYVVRSSGHEAGSVRTVSARLVATPRFPYAAFADSSVEFRGGNDARSYDSRNGGQDTGNGRVGSNGDVTYRGNADADGTDVYDYENDPDNRCTGDPCSRVVTHDDRLDISSPAATTFIQQAFDTCAADPSRTPVAWVASQSAGRLTPSPNGFYCYTSMTFDVDTTVVTADPAGSPVVAYVSGPISVSNGVRVNYSSVAPRAQALQLYSIGTRVAIGNHAKVAAAIWAPRAECLGNPSNAQAEIFGSMVCRTIDNQGGWDFFYDDALGGITDGTWRVLNYAEESGTEPVAVPASGGSTVGG